MEDNATAQLSVMLSSNPLCKTKRHTLVCLFLLQRTLSDIIFKTAAVFERSQRCFFFEVSNKMSCAVKADFKRNIRY